MAFNVTPPNELGCRSNTGGAMPGPKATGADPAPPNAMGSRKNEESGKNPTAGAFPSPPNASSPEPGRGGKM